MFKKYKIILWTIAFFTLAFVTQLAFAGFQNNSSNYGYPLTIAPSITQNLLTIVAFLLGTSSFILGLSIQNSTRLTSTMSRYFRILILAMVIPSLVIIVYGIVLVEITLDADDVHYLLLLFALFVPAGAILFLLHKLHSTVPDPKPS